MNILLVVANYLPEIGSAAHLYHDLGKKFSERGHDVHVITSYPREFYLDDEDKGKEFPMDETIDGVSVHRAKFKFAVRDNPVMRGLEHFLLPRLYFKKYKKINFKPDVALIYIPPLPLYKLGKKIRKKDNIPFISNYQDIHPQELVDGGVVKNPLWIKILEHFERKSYKAPDHITVMSPKGRDLIEERGGKNVECIFNGIDVEEKKNELPAGDFKEEEGIVDKTMITYAGILSPFQGIGHILDTAKLLEDHDELIFYIIGDGMSKENLQERIDKENISNVKMMDLQPRDEYFKIINSSDINIVSLDSRMTAPCIPGKVKDLLSVQKPIIGNVPSHNDTAQIINGHGCGIQVEPGNPKQFAKAVLKIKRNPKLAEKMKKNAWDFLTKNMDMEKNVNRYEEIFRELT